MQRFLRSFFGDLAGKMMVEMVVWSGYQWECVGVKKEKKRVQSEVWPAKEKRVRYLFLKHHGMKGKVYF